MATRVNFHGKGQSSRKPLFLFGKIWEDHGRSVSKIPLHLLSHLWSLDGCPCEVHTTYRQRVTGTRCPARQMCHLNLQGTSLTIPTVQGCKGKESKRKATMYETMSHFHGALHCASLYLLELIGIGTITWNVKSLAKTSANTSTCRFEHLLSNQVVHTSR